MKIKLIILGVITLISSDIFAVDIAPSAMEEQPLTENANALEQIGQKDSASAPEGTMFGRIRSTVIQNTFSQGDVSYNHFDTTTDARLGYTVKSKVEGWVTSGTIDFDMQSADSSVNGRYLYVTLENELLSFRLGRQEPGGSTLGGKHLQDIDNTLAIGETIGDGDYFTLGIKSVGARVIIGRHAVSGDTSANEISNDEKAQALFWEGSAGGQKFTASYTMIAERTNEKAVATETGSVHGAEDYAAYAIGWQIPFGDLKFSVNYDDFTQVYLDSARDPEDITTSIFFWDYKTTKNSGATLAYSVQATTDGSDNPTKFTSLDFGYTYYIGIIRFYSAYNQTSTIDADNPTNDKTTSQFGLGLGAFFK
ncbi:MAG: hypothetical protein QNL04_07915 [SAR324 cluster bacterium]|nr:hypothetical protein [SAR324 cluster bacterium]